MEPKPENPYVYFVSEGVRIFYARDQEIRFRKGIWNYQEANLQLQGQPAAVQAFFTQVVSDLMQKDSVDLAAIAQQQGIAEPTLHQYQEVLQNIQRQGFLYQAQDQEISRLVSLLLSSNIAGLENYVREPRPVLFVSDNEYSQKAAKTIAEEIHLPLDVLDSQTFHEIASMDLTTKTDAISVLKNTDKLKPIFAPYDAVIGSFAAPHLCFLRNLNRILLSIEKPLILGLIDGPFLTLVATQSPQTGCFECFEQRMLVRLEDHVAYHKFVASMPLKTIQSKIFTPPLHLLTSAVVSEGFLHASLGVLRLSGRILNIYLPVLEIQVQDLLRVPYCPGCGFIAAAQMKEMYTSSKKVMDQMLQQVEIQRPT